MVLEVSRAEKRSQAAISFARPPWAPADVSDRAAALSHRGSKARLRACARKSIRSCSSPRIKLPPASQTGAKRVATGKGDISQHGRSAYAAPDAMAICAITDPLRHWLQHSAGLSGVCMRKSPKLDKQSKYYMSFDGVQRDQRAERRECERHLPITILCGVPMQAIKSLSTSNQAPVNSKQISFLSRTIRQRRVKQDCQHA